jgi:FkbM family methyltransferase
VHSQDNPLIALAVRIANIVNPLFYLTNQNRKVYMYRVTSDTKFKIRVNSADKISIWETWKLQSYIKNDSDIKPADTVIDLGAHIGAFTIFAARKAPLGRVYAFEPEPNNFRLLKENIFLNSLNNVYPFQKAVTGKLGKVKLFVESDSSSTNSILEYTYQTPKKTISVSSTTLEHILTDNHIDTVDLLKIDIEGAEYDVLLNTPPHIFKKIKRIALEYHDNLNHEHTIKQLVDFLHAQGFKTKKDNALFITRFLKMGLVRAWR